MRGRVLNWPVVGRAALVGALAVAAIGDAVSLASGYVRAHPPAVASMSLADPGSRELLRCQALGVAAENDSHCHDVWAQSRRQFLTYRSSSRKPSSSWPSILIEGHE